MIFFQTLRINRQNFVYQYGHFLFRCNLGTFFKSKNNFIDQSTMKIFFTKA